MVSNGLIVGHALTVTDPALDEALNIGTVIEGTLGEVLTLTWVSSDVRDTFAEQMHAALGQISDQLRVERSAQRGRDLDAKLPLPQETLRSVF